MVYRQSADSSKVKDTAVACEACGVLASFHGETEATFRCEGCELEQPTRRVVAVEADGGGDEDLTAIASLELVAHKPGNYAELSPLLEDLGRLNTKAIAIDFRCDGILCDVSLSLNSGAVTGLDMVARSRGLMPMQLVVERTAHTDKKERGILREVQTGDRTFDDQVYIESNASDADVRTFLASPAVRKAAPLLLHQGSDTIKIDETGVSIFVSKTRNAFAQSAIRSRLGLLRVLAGGPRPLVVEVVPARPAATATKVLAFSFTPIAILVLVMGAVNYPTTTIRQPALSLGLGLLLAVLLGPLFTWLLRGRSTSDKDILLVRIGTFVSLPLFSLGASLILNGAMDRSPETEVEMVIADQSVDSDNSDVMHVKTFDSNKESHSYSFHDTSLVVGKSRVRAYWRSGALGWRWESRDAEVIP